ncbi:MAG: tetratricopeptide repeat protein [Planctomycetes bacterium]|nr:tetratricopeptide repeat protein [Planctomycetota bacterium]
MRRILPLAVLAVLVARAPAASAEDAAAAPPAPDGAPAPAAPAAPPEADPAAARKHAEQGDLLREEGKWDAAAREYGKSLDADEAQYLVHVRYQESVIRSGKGDELVPEYDDLLKQHPTDAVLKLHRMRLDAPASRVERLAPAVKATPGDAPTQLELGRAALAVGDNAVAKKALEAAFAIAPRLADVFELSCEALRRAGDTSGLRTRLENRLKQEPESYETLIRLARLDLVEGRTKEAYERAIAVLGMRPSYVVAMLVRSEAASRLGKGEEALQSLEAVLRLNPADPDALVASADLTAKGAAEEGLKRAVDLYKKALDVKPTPPALRAWYGLGWAYERLGQLKEAGEAYREAALLSPTDAAIVNSVGVVLLKQKSFQSALLQFRKAIDLDPKSPEAYLNVAMVAEQQTDWNEAIKQYQKVLGMKGQEGNVRALLNCAFDHEALSQYKKAEELLLRVRQLRPQDSDVATFLGDNLFFQKKWKDAVRAYQDAVKLDEKNRFAWRGLGMALAQDDKPKEGIEALEKARALKPDDPPTLLVLGDLYFLQQDLEKALEAYKAYVKAGGTNQDVPVLIEGIEKELAGAGGGK